MPCSAVTLSLATVSAIVAVALLAIAFSTDNWLTYNVERTSIQKFASLQSDQSSALLDKFTSKYYYYSRTRGLFRICFPKERPPAASEKGTSYTKDRTTQPSNYSTYSEFDIYLSPVETHCSNIDYFPTDKGSNDDSVARLHLARSCIGLFILSFVAVFCAFWAGLSGCWRRSAGSITATAILMLVACLLSAGAIGVWHTVEFFEKEKVVGEEFYQEWSAVLKDNTRIIYDWSYITAWAGVAASLVAFVLLSGAAICLRSEREKEDQLNLQYLMPVYSQKQPSYPGYAGYPQPHIYSGPYYHGSQYGPYNY